MNHIKCSGCGQFMAYSDLDNVATHRSVVPMPDSYSYDSPDVNGVELYHKGQYCGFL